MQTKSILTLFSAAVMSLVLFTSAGNKPKRLFMVGDSTMADKTELDISPERGWGQLFPTYLTEDIIVENHAMNGRSTKSFIDEHRWDSVLSRISRGDIVIIQFGHNDQKITDPNRYASIEDYENNLMLMIEQAKKKGADVILCTPISRRAFNKQTGEFIHKHGGYPEAAKRVAQRMKVPMLDLEEATAQWLTELGDEESKQYFMNVAPGECQKFPDGKIDNTHLRENGALIVGKMAADMIVSQKIKCLQKSIVLDATEPKYTTFCRPNMPTDSKKTESDQKADLK